MGELLNRAFAGTPVLVTGATGFVGRRLVARLRSLGARVTALLEASEVLPEAWTDAARGPLPVPVVADITDAAIMLQTLQECRPRRVFHLAAITAHSERLSDLPRYLRINAEGVGHLLEACARVDSRPEGIVALGSAEEYGPQETMPLHEGLPLRPVTPYGISKAAATSICRSACILEDLPVVVLRPFLLYGPGQSPRFFMSQLVQAMLERRKMEMTSGRQTRDFLHVDDAIEGMLMASGSPSLQGEAANLCSGREIALADLCRLVQEVAGVQEEIVVLGALPHRRGEIFRYVGSYDRLRAATGWEPRISIEEGLRRLLEGSRTS